MLKKKGKNQLSCAVTGNSSSTSSSTLQLSSVPIDLQSPSTESITKPQQILPSQSIEAQSSTSQGESDSQLVPAIECSTISQLTSVSESIDRESSTLQGHSDSSQPDVSVNDIVTQDVNTSTDETAGNNDDSVVCIFCDRKKNF